jgi:hypothetical protein
MPATNLQDQIRELAALSSQQNKALAAGAPPHAPSGHTAAMSYPVGSRVLDLVTGQTGVVIDGFRRNVVVSSPANQGG